MDWAVELPRELWRTAIGAELTLGERVGIRTTCRTLRAVFPELGPSWFPPSLARLRPALRRALCAICPGHFITNYPWWDEVPVIRSCTVSLTVNGLLRVDADDVYKPFHFTFGFDHFELVRCQLGSPRWPYPTFGTTRGTLALRRTRIFADGTRCRTDGYWLVIGDHRENADDIVLIWEHGIIGVPEEDRFKYSVHILRAGE